MFKLILNSIFLFVFSFQTIAAPLNEAKSIKDVMVKYDYLLSAHPDAHKKEFRDKMIKKFQEDLKVSVNNTSKEELKKSFDQLLNEIPSKEKRETYLKVLKNSSKKEIVSYLTDPTLLQDSLKGESANFFITNSVALDIIIIVFGGLILYAIIEAIVVAIKYETFKSYSLSFGGACTTSNLEWNYSYAQIEAAKDNAYSKCRNGAKHPSTCKWAGWDWNETSYYDEWDDSTYYDCSVKATYRADRKR